MGVIFLILLKSFFRLRLKILLILNVLLSLFSEEFLFMIRVVKNIII